MNITLHSIAKACMGQLILTSEAQAAGISEDTRITGAVLDSRKVQEGNLFFATVGERVDGHSFIGSVFGKGAVCVVTQKSPETVEAEHGICATSWGAYILVEDTFQALKQIGEYYRSTLQIPIVGITGSVGKTSTKEFIASVLAQKYNVLKTEGNYNNEIGVPLTILRITEETEVAVIEMGISDFGEMHRLSKMARPNICVITNIGQCHLENLKTRDGILKAKTEIFDYMDPEGHVCLNGDDDKLATVTKVHGKAVHFFGLGENQSEEVYASDIVGKGLFGSEACLHLSGESGTASECASWGDKKLAITVSLPGVHMVINAAAAACVGRLLHVTDEQIVEGIRKAKAVGGRSHLIPLSDYTLIDDCYNANPVSMRAAIDLLNMADTAKVAILGDMFELGENSDLMHTQTGEYAADAGLDVLICIGENAKYLYEGAQKQKPAGVNAAGKQYYFATKAEFLEALRTRKEELLPRFSTILIKASHGMGFSEIVAVLQG